MPDDPRTLSALGLAGWDVIPLLVLNNTGTAELWTGDMAAAEKHLRAAVDTNQWNGLLRPHLNAASQLALLLAERGDLDAAQADAQAAVQRATEAGWAVSAQAVAAYLALACVSLDRSEPEGVDRWLGRVAEVEAVAPEPHVQLAAAALNALRRADTGDWEGARTALRAATGLTESAPPVLADRVVLVQAELLRRTGDLRQAADVLTRLRGPATPHTAHALARLHLAAGDAAAAEQSLAPFPALGTVRQRVDGGILCTLIAAEHNQSAALQLLEDALLAAAPLGMRRPFLVEAAGLRALLGRADRGRHRGGGLRRGPAASDVRATRPAAGAPASLVEALTEREQVVLRYLASTLSNAEIAARAVPVGEHREDPPAHDLPQTRRRRSTRRRPTSEAAPAALTSVAPSRLTAVAAAFERRLLG